MVQAWIYARQGLTMNDGRAYGFINLVFKDDGKLSGFQTYVDDYERKKKVKIHDDPKRIVEFVESFRPEEIKGWCPPLDMALKTEISREKIDNIKTLHKILEQIRQTLKELQEKAEKTEKELYDSIYSIYKKRTTYRYSKAMSKAMHRSVKS